MESINTLWSRRSGMIFFSIIFLTIFGWMAGVMEYILSFAGWIDSTLKSLSLFALSDVHHKVENVQSALSGIFITFQVLTLICWITYLYGIYQFRYAQSTETAVFNVRRVNTACWLGVISILCTLLSTWMPYGTQWIFKLAAWILILVSYIKFKNAFGALSMEDSWSDRARRGAAQLRKSAVYNIRLMFFPLLIIAVGIVDYFILSSMIGSFTEGLNSVISLLIIEVIVLAIVALWWSVMQFVYRLTGWYKIWKGGNALCGEEATEEVVEYVYEDVITDNTPDENQGRNSMLTAILIALAVACAIGVGVAFFLNKPSVDEEVEYVDYSDDLTSDTGSEATTAVYPDARMLGLEGDVKSVKYSREGTGWDYIDIKFNRDGSVVTSSEIKITRDSRNRITTYECYYGPDNEDNYQYTLVYRGAKNTPVEYHSGSWGGINDVMLTFDGGVLVRSQHDSTYEGEEGEYNITNRYKILSTDSHGNWTRRRVDETTVVAYTIENEAGEYVPKRDESKDSYIETRTITYFN